jgi:hypothetical protein
VTAGAWVTAPEANVAWKLDDNPGEEIFWIISSVRPFERQTIDEIIAGKSKKVDLDSFEKKVTTTERKVDIIMTLRGGVDMLKKKESVPEGFFEDSKGFWAEGTQIDPKTGLPIPGAEAEAFASSGKAVVKTERAVGMNTVVKRFTIKHVAAR